MLRGVRVIEIAGIGPGPFCGLLLADLGADVILVEQGEKEAGAVDLGSQSLINRGKRSIVLDLKSQQDVATLLRLIKTADVLVEGFRPNVMERAGVGPADCRAVNPRLVYGRMTGWGQDGPMAHLAGHDLNYIALSGALWYAGEKASLPFTPPSLVGDIPGALYLAIGILSAVMRARSTGQGCTIDAAIFDANTHMMSLLWALRQRHLMNTERGTSVLDGSHWSRTYRCACGGHFAVQCYEKKFYRIFLERLGLSGDPRFADQFNCDLWPAQSAHLEQVFANKTRDEWSRIFNDSDACAVPVLDPDEAAAHPHNAARRAYIEVDGVLQAAPAPRFLDGPLWRPKPCPGRGQHTQEILSEIRDVP
jgi:alpha-methylacyl-CoA racemase